MAITKMIFKNKLKKEVFLAKKELDGGDWYGVPYDCDMFHEITQTKKNLF